MATATGSAIAADTEQQANQLRQEMRQIRRELGQDVEELVVQAERLMDWRYYVRRYPWAMLGVAAFVGFYIVPRRTVTLPTDSGTLAKLAERIPQPVVIQNEPPKPRTSLLGSLVSSLAGMAMKAASTYAGQQVGKILAQQAGHERPEEIHREQPTGRV